MAQALQEGEAQACFSNAPPALIVGPCTAKANAKVMLATALQCYSIFAVVAMAFVPSASSAIGSQPLKNDSAGILPFADHDEVRSFYLLDLCIFVMSHQLLPSSAECINVNIGSNSGSGPKRVSLFF